MARTTIPATRLPLPTSRGDWRLLGRTVRLVVTIPRYGLLALVSAWASLSVFAFSQNVPLVKLALTGSLPLENRLTILWTLYPFAGSVFSAEVGGLLVAISLLAGADIALVAYHLLRFGLDARTSGGGAVGVVLGVLGAGCAACGTVILAGLLSLFGVAGALTLLPFEGLEFTILAAVALLLSLYWLADGMRGNEINGCPVDF